MSVATELPMVTRCPACCGGLVALYGTGRGDVIAYGEWEQMPGYIVLRAVCQYSGCREEFDITFTATRIESRQEETEQ